MRFFSFISSSAPITLFGMDRYWSSRQPAAYGDIQTVSEKYGKIPSIALLSKKNQFSIPYNVESTTTTRHHRFEFKIRNTDGMPSQLESLIVCRLCAEVSRAVVFYDNVKAIHSEYFFNFLCRVFNT